MKKVLSAIALLMAILIIALCCAACGDDEKKDDASNTPTTASEQNTAEPTDLASEANEATKTGDSPAQADTADTLAGYYKLTGGTGIDEDLLAQVIPTASLVINEDHSGTITMLGQSMGCTFDPDAMTATLENGAEATYTFDGTTILIDMGEEDSQTWVKDNTADTPAAGESDLAGTYTLDQSENQGTLTIKADNTGVMTDGYTTYDMTFNPEDSTVIIVVYGTTLDGTYTFDGEKLAITANGTTIELVKD